LRLLDKPNPGLVEEDHKPARVREVVEEAAIEAVVVL